MKVSVIGAWKPLYEGRASHVVLPADNGEMCVLDFHQSFVCRLRSGFIRVVEGVPGRATGEIDPSTPQTRIAVKDGLARMTGNELTILVEV